MKTVEILLSPILRERVSETFGGPRPPFENCFQRWSIDHPQSESPGSPHKMCISLPIPDLWYRNSHWSSFLTCWMELGTLGWGGSKVPISHQSWVTLLSWHLLPVVAELGLRSRSQRGAIAWLWHRSRFTLSGLLGLPFTIFVLLHHAGKCRGQPDTLPIALKINAGLAYSSLFLQPTKARRNEEKDRKDRYLSSLRRKLCSNLNPTWMCVPWVSHSPGPPFQDIRV